MEIKIDNIVTLIIDEDIYEKIKDLDIRYYFHHRNKNPYFVIFIDKVRFWLHRFIMNCTQGDKTQIDHINGKPWDNRRVNLRICKKGALNAINRPKQKNNTSGYKGVGVKGKKFNASIRVNQKLLHLGNYFTAEEAALAYNKAAYEHFGEFAYMNTISEKEKS